MSIVITRLTELATAYLEEQAAKRELADARTHRQNLERQANSLRSDNPPCTVVVGAKAVTMKRVTHNEIEYTVGELMTDAP